MLGVRARALTGVAAPALSGYFLDKNMTFA